MSASKHLRALFLTACFVLILAVAGTASAATLKLVNKSASEIHAIYISGSDSDDWEENIIDGYLLPPGNQVDVTIPNYRAFDLRVEDEEGNAEDYHDFPGKTRRIVIRGGGESEYR